MKKNKNKKILIILLIGALISSTAIFYGLSITVKTYYKKTISDNLIQIVTILSQSVDPDLLNNLIKNNEKDGSVKYIEALKKLKQIHKLNKDIKYIYTVHSKDNQVLFGLDTADYTDSNKDGVVDHSDFNSTYDEAPPVILEAINTQKPTVSKNPYTDKWGTFLGAYFPIMDKNEKMVSLLCVEIEYGEYLNNIRKLDNYLLMIYLLSVMVTILFFIFVNKTQKQSMELLESKYREDNLWNDIKMAEVGKMMASLNHEINNPLQIIKGFTTLIIEKPMTEEKRMSCLNKIKNSVDRVQNVIFFVKSLARDSEAEEKKEVDVLKLTHACADFLSFKTKDTEVKITLPSTQLTLYCQETGLQQVLINIISNAIEEVMKYPVKEIDLDFKIQELFTDIIITDSGQGIPEKLRAKIQNGFTTSKKDGTGLGLLLCKKILANNNGELIYQRVDNKTQFICRFHNT